MYNKEEKTINLIDVCFFVLKRWKMMVLAGIVLAAAVAGGTYMKSTEEYKEYQMEMQLPIHEVVETVKLSPDEKFSLQAKIDVIEEYKQNIAEYEYYLKNSVKVKLDPNCFYEGVVKYLLSSEDNAEAMKAINLCYEQVFKEDNYMALAECLVDKTDVALLKEVVSVEEERFVDEFEKKYDADVLFTIKVQHYAQNDCENMVAYYVKELENMQDIFEDEALNVKFERVSSDVKTCSDQALVLLSHDINTAKVNAYDGIANIEKNMTDAQKEYYVLSQKMKEEPSGSSEEMLNNVPKPSVDWKIVVIAAIAGAFLMAGFYGILYLFNGCVHNKEELESWLNVPILNAEEKEEMVAVLLAGIAEEKGAKTVYLSNPIGGNDEKNKKIKELLEKKGLNIRIGNGILQDVKALQEAAECGFIVFIEKCNVSKEKDITEELDKVASCGINTLGIILEK